MMFRDDRDSSNFHYCIYSLRLHLTIFGGTVPNCQVLNWSVAIFTPFQYSNLDWYTPLEYSSESAYTRTRDWSVAIFTPLEYSSENRLISGREF